MKLTDHFTLEELTRTDRPEFAEMNKQVTPEQLEKLTQVARLLEHCRYVLGTPLIVHSGYRCPALNKAVGSTDRSQHLLCEAADFTPAKMDLGDAFRKLMVDILDAGANVGQLIYERQDRSYGKTEWLHVSLGTPYRSQERSKQILSMTNGIYTRLDA